MRFTSFTSQRGNFGVSSCRERQALESRPATSDVPCAFSAPAVVPSVWSLVKGHSRFTPAPVPEQELSSCDNTEFSPLSLNWTTVTPAAFGWWKLREYPGPCCMGSILRPAHLVCYFLCATSSFCPQCDASNHAYQPSLAWQSPDQPLRITWILKLTDGAPPSVNALFPNVW